MNAMMPQAQSAMPVTGAEQEGPVTLDTYDGVTLMQEVYAMAPVSEDAPSEAVATATPETAGGVTQRRPGINAAILSAFRISEFVMHEAGRLGWPPESHRFVAFGGFPPLLCDS